ncbi:BglG family transcription antiterminator [Pontibacillus marinus]|uniref:PTS lichenan transporter subunit IIC n=1 Tax=Pontibacillus marinus BH030004 = DSM 16465 TaxID=1385511 RepID=A0A0A5GJ24_9BACI|nr:BglG family transcription antiterminator [Pontibacillus marinus]KGX91228.1 PTS lichenan transporter subunit IIC [Pontibacillus marinus BH030004 = DSM 16465]
MILDQRRTHILYQIQSSQVPVSEQWLQDKMGVSSRTIYYDVRHINEWLESEGMEPIQRKRGEGFYLPDHSRDAIKDKVNLTHQWQYQLSQDERVLLISLYALTTIEPITMKWLLEKMQFSRGTIVKDLKHVDENMKSYDLRVLYERGKGYKVKGLELKKRKLLSYFIQTIQPKEKWSHLWDEVYAIFSNHFEREDASHIIKSLVHESEQFLGVTFTDEMLEYLTIQLHIMLIRANQNLEIDSDEFDVLVNTKAYQSAKLLEKQLEEEFQIQFSDEEVAYLTTQILGSKVEYDNFSATSEAERKKLYDIVRRIIDEFQIYSCVLFEDREQLEQNLLTHMKPMYYRLKYGVSMNSDMSEYIQDQYHDVYELTRKSLFPLEEMIGFNIPDNEVAYIAMHFGGWLKKQNKTLNRKYQAIIVCENGIGTSNMVKAQLEAMLNDVDIVKAMSFREYRETDIDVDIIFATNYLKPKEIPVVHVPVLLSDSDKQYVMNQLSQHLSPGEKSLSEVEQMLQVIDQYATVHDRDALKQELEHYQTNQNHTEKEPYTPMLDELLTSETILFRDSMNSWEEAIRTASEPLLEQGKIQENYIEAMINNVHELGPYIVIAPQIAIPHARPEEGVEQLGMSLLRVNDPVAFSDQEKHNANLVIVLAAIDNETHLKALSQLTTMLSEEDNIGKLVKAQNSEEVIELINTYSTH